MGEGGSVGMFVAVCSWDLTLSTKRCKSYELGVKAQVKRDHSAVRNDVIVEICLSVLCFAN